MSDDPILRHVADLDTVDEVLCRLCDTPDEVAAVKRVLGVDAQERRAAQAFTPDRPPPTPVGLNVDHLAVAQDAVTRYAAWVDSHPDDDPTPLRNRERALRLALRSVERLQGTST